MQKIRMQIMVHFEIFQKIENKMMKKHHPYMSRTIEDGLKGYLIIANLDNLF